MRTFKGTQWLKLKRSYILQGLSLMHQKPSNSSPCIQNKSLCLIPAWLGILHRLCLGPLIFKPTSALDLEIPGKEGFSSSLQHICLQLPTSRSPCMFCSSHNVPCPRLEDCASCSIQLKLTAGWATGWAVQPPSVLQLSCQERHRLQELWGESWCNEDCDSRGDGFRTWGLHKSPSLEQW